MSFTEHVHQKGQDNAEFYSDVIKNNNVGVITTIIYFME